MEKVWVEGYVKQRSKAHPVPLLVEASLGANRHPGLLLAVNVVLPAAAGADCAPHLLLEACGHGLLGLVCEVDARDIADASPLHVLDDVVPDPSLVGVHGVNRGPVVL